MGKTKKLCCVAVPSQMMDALSATSLHLKLVSPKKASKNHNQLAAATAKRQRRLWCLFSTFAFALFGMLKLGFTLDLLVAPPSPIRLRNALLPASRSEINARSAERFEDLEQWGGHQWADFWKQPDGLGFRPCLGFSGDYRRTSAAVIKDRSKYLMVVVSGGMNQQRNQIVDAVVIARILGAALVVPILQVNVIWADESEFSDIFDLEHFKAVLANHVRVVSSLPSTHLMSRPVEEKRTPPHVSPRWIRQRYLSRLRREGVLLLRGLDSRLSKDLPSDLQKLRCKVAFHALRFAPQILELGNRLTERMRSKGPYLALHLRMEKDVWVRTGCLPGLSPEYDEMITNERKLHPELLTAKSNLTYHERKLAGLCPLNAMDVSRLLKALGAPKNARIYWAGGEPLGGKDALLPLIREFPHFHNKEDLALPRELEPFANRASSLAAIDYIVSENSNVFMASHGGNMGHTIQGHRAYAGHKKHITPNKRQMLPYFLNPSLPEAEFNQIIMELHRDSLGQPELRTTKAGRDVTKYPIPECMCNNTNADSRA